MAKMISAKDKDNPGKNDDDAAGTGREIALIVSAQRGSEPVINLPCKLVTLPPPAVKA